MASNATSSLLNQYYNNDSMFELSDYTMNTSSPSNVTATTLRTFQGPLYSSEITGLFAFMTAVTSLFTTTGNILVVISFIVEKSLRQPSNYLIASLAVTDILIGMFSMPFYSLYLLMQQYWPLGQTLCDLWLSMDYTVCLVSQYTVFLITLDRFCSVKAPAKYRNWRTKCKIKIMISITWIFPAFIFFTSIMGWRTFTGSPPPNDNSCAVEFQSNKIFSVLLVISYYWVTLIVMIGMYISIYHVAWSLHAKSRAKRTRMSQMKRLTNNNKQIGGEEASNARKSTKPSYSRRSDKNGNSKVHEREDTSDYSNDQSSSNSSCSKQQVSNDPDFEPQSACITEQTETLELDTTLSGSPLWKPRRSFEYESIHWGVFNKQDSNASNRPEADKLMTDGDNEKVDTQELQCEIDIADSKDLPKNILLAQIMKAYIRLRRFAHCKRLKSGSPQKKSKGENRARKALKTISFILGAFVVCWTPYHVVVIIAAFCPTCVNQTFFNFSYWLCYMNSPLNPFCYALSNRQFKETFIKIIKGKYCRFRNYY